MSYVTESSDLQSLLPMKCLPVPGKKLNIVLLCFVPQMVPTMRSTEHIRMYQFLQYTLWLKIFILFYCHLRPNLFCINLCFVLTSDFSFIGCIHQSKSKGVYCTVNTTKAKHWHFCWRCWW